MSTSAEVFYARAEHRIPRFMGAVFLLAAAVLWPWWGSGFVLGFAIGAAVAAVNLLWLKQITSAFVERLSGTGAGASAWGVVFRFLLRYALIALLAYGMLANRAVSINGFLAGLFLPVAALACEAVYELYVALRRGL
ncbi:MAG: ATP synthase subunit I [Acidobacteria bacterium]|nr:ATP synthase subunit I [Acidobacteriota bacterium]